MADPRFIPDDIEQTADVPFTDDSQPPLHLDLFRMRRMQFTAPQPVIIWIHGGGWFTGDKERGVERIFGLVRSGFVGASISYRLSQEALFPAQLHDSKCAVRFLRAHASTHNIDPARIGVWGASAGGHLASLVAVTDREKALEGERGWATFPSKVQAACSWFGPSDFNLMDEFPPGVTGAMPGRTAESAQGKLVGGAIAERQDVVAMANPIRHIHSECPPVLLMHGAKDDYVPLASSERFHAALVEHGVQALLHVIKDGHHNAYLWGDQHLQLAKEFFEWHLRELL